MYFVVTLSPLNHQYVRQISRLLSNVPKQFQNAAVESLHDVLEWRGSIRTFQLLGLQPVSLNYFEK